MRGLEVVGFAGLNAAGFVRGARLRAGGRSEIREGL